MQTKSGLQPPPMIPLYCILLAVRCAPLALGRFPVERSCFLGQVLHAHLRRGEFASQVKLDANGLKVPLESADMYSIQLGRIALASFATQK